jgi:predicted DNA binding CopG/RHH family protein
MKDKISEDEVFEDYQDGLPEDFTFEESHIRRKHVDLKNSTVQISLKIEYELFKDIRRVAEQKAISYQALIKQILQDYCQHASLEQRVQRIEEKLAQLEART